MINYAKAKNKAISLKRSGFGKTDTIINYNAHILSYIELDELTQLVAISFYRANIECKNFYSVLCNEIARMGLYRNRNKETVDFCITDFKNDIQIRQLHNLYCAIGFELFYKYLKPSEPRSTVQKWCWKCFATRKNDPRLSLKTKREINRILKTGGRIRFSKSSSSVYIENNEVTIRISDHSEDAKCDFHKIKIDYVN